MGKSITRDFTIAAGVGLVVGIAVAIYVVNVHRPSEFEEAILLTLVHELWVIDKLFDVNWTKQTFLVVHGVTPFWPSGLFKKWFVRFHGPL